MLSSAPTKVSKKRHVRRAIKRRAAAWVGDTGTCPAIGGGRLAHRAMDGDSIHRITQGGATSRDPSPGNRPDKATATAKEPPPATRAWRVGKARELWRCVAAAA